MYKFIRFSLTIIFLICFNIEGNAAVRRFCFVQYETQYGWSKSYKMEVTFLTGFELSRNTGNYNFDLYGKYALLWFGEGEVAILKINSYAITGTELNRNDFRSLFMFSSSVDAVQVNDEEKTTWRITGKNYLSFVDVVDEREN